MVNLFELSLFGSQYLSKADFLQAIRWLRGDRHDIEGEIKALENSQRKSDDSGAGSASGQVDQKNSTLHELSKPSAYKPFLLLIGIFVLQQSTGTYAVIFYAVNVFQVKPFYKDTAYRFIA